MQIMEAWTTLILTLYIALFSITPVYEPVTTDSLTGRTGTHIGEFQFHLHLNIHQGSPCTEGPYVHYWYSHALHTMGQSIA